MGQYKAVTRKGLVKDPERYKTLICVNWAKTGECPYDEKCQFAHGPDELRCRPDLHPSVSQPVVPKPGMPPLPPGPPSSPPVATPPASGIDATSNGHAMPKLQSATPQSPCMPCTEGEEENDENDEALLRDIHRLREEDVLYEGFSYFSVLPL